MESSQVMTLSFLNMYKETLLQDPTTSYLFYLSALFETFQSLKSDMKNSCHISTDRIFNMGSWRGVNLRV